MKQFDFNQEVVNNISKYGHISTGYAEHFPWLLKFLEGDLILDLGIGELAIFSKFLAETRKVIGVDWILKPKPSKAIRKMNICLVHCVFQQLPFRGGFFEWIVSNSSIEHNRDEDFGEIFGEISKMLKGGGKIIFTVPFGTDGRRGDARVFSKESLEKYLAKASLKIIDMKPLSSEWGIIAIKQSL